MHIHRSLASQGSLEECGQDGLTDHSTCPAEEYCATFAERGTPRCVRCQFCPPMPDRPDFAIPNDGTCPAKCDCSQHNQCQADEYCYAESPTQNICTSCKHCRNTARKPFDSNTACPERCLCRTSSECGKGEYCSLQPASDSLVPENTGLCVTCAGTTGCLEGLLVNRDQEKCKDVCPDDFECSQHEDCDTSVGQWCSFNHRCNECSSQCWSPLRSVVNSTERWWETVDRNLLNNIPHDSIDFECPETCCNWGLTVDRSTQTQFTVGFCHADQKVQGFWDVGHRPDYIAADFLQRGIPCKEQIYEYETGFPKIVTVVDCSAASTSCELARRTLGLLTQNTSSVLPTFWQMPDDFPLLATYDNTNVACSLEEAGGSLGLSFFISFICAFSFFFLFTTIVVYRTREENRKRQKAL